MQTKGKGSKVLVATRKRKKFVVFIAEDITFPDPWEGGDFTLLAGGVLVDNGDNSVYGINPVEFWNTYERT